jgi:hypothetical protein
MKRKVPSLFETTNLKRQAPESQRLPLLFNRQLIIRKSNNSRPPRLSSA